MRYLEPNQLEPNQIYFCVLYDGTSGYLEYKNGYFEDDKYTYRFDGDVRYVFESIGDYVRSCRENDKDVVLVSITGLGRLSGR